MEAIQSRMVSGSLANGHRIAVPSLILLALRCESPLARCGHFGFVCKPEGFVFYFKLAFCSVRFCEEDARVIYVLLWLVPRWHLFFFYSRRVQ